MRTTRQVGEDTGLLSDNQDETVGSGCDPSSTVGAQALGSAVETTPATGVQRGHGYRLELTLGCRRRWSDTATGCQAPWVTSSSGPAMPLLERNL